MSGRGFMLDTNTASAALLRRPQPIHERLASVSPARVCVSVITEAELRFGVSRRPDAIRLARDVEDFLRRVDILPWNSAAATRYGPLRAALEIMGRPLAALDTLIAAHALAEDAILVSHDRAFARVPGLTIEDWLAT